MRAGKRNDQHRRQGGVERIVLHDDRGAWTLSDNERTRIKNDRMLRPYFCLRAGKRYDSDASSLPPLAEAA